MLNAAVAIFLLEDVALLLYTLLILKRSHLFFFRLKKTRPSSKIGPAMAGPTGPVPPGLSFIQKLEDDALTIVYTEKRVFNNKSRKTITLEH